MARIVRRLSGANAAALIIALIGVAGLPASAQTPPQPSVKTGNLELGAFGGESYGLDRFRPMGGANIAYGLSRALFPFAEASYLPGVLRSFPFATGSTVSNTTVAINMTDFHVGLHIRVPRPESRVVPYGVIGLGLIRGGQTTATYYLVSNFPGQVAIQRQTVPSSVNLAVNVGGGLRFFFTERFAVRMEFKAFRPTSAPTPLEPRFFYRFAIGPVFQLR